MIILIQGWSVNHTCHGGEVEWGAANLIIYEVEMLQNCTVTSTSLGLVKGDQSMDL